MCTLASLSQNDKTFAYHLLQLCRSLEVWPKIQQLSTSDLQHIALGFSYHVDTSWVKSKPKRLWQRKEVLAERHPGLKPMKFTINALFGMARIVGFTMSTRVWDHIATFLTTCASTAPPIPTHMPHANPEPPAEPLADLDEAQDVVQCLHRDAVIAKQTLELNRMRVNIHRATHSLLYWKRKACSLIEEETQRKKALREGSLWKGKCERFLTVRGGMSHAIFRSVGHASTSTTAITLNSGVVDSTVLAWELRAYNAILSGHRTFYSSMEAAISVETSRFFSVHLWEGDATNSNAIGKSKVCSSRYWSSYMSAPIEPSQYCEADSVLTWLNKNDAWTDMQTCSKNSTGRTSHDMIVKQCEGVGGPLWDGTHNLHPMVKRSYVAASDGGPDVRVCRDIMRAHCKKHKHFLRP